MPSGKVSLLFMVDKLECPSMVVHNAALKLNLQTKHGYFIVIGDRNGQLIMTHVSLSNIHIWNIEF